MLVALRGQGQPVRDGSQGRRTTQRQHHGVGKRCCCAGKGGGAGVLTLAVNVTARRRCCFWLGVPRLKTAQFVAQLCAQDLLA